MVQETAAERIEMAVAEVMVVVTWAMETMVEEVVTMAGAEVVADWVVAAAAAGGREWREGRQVCVGG